MDAKHYKRWLGLSDDIKIHYEHKKMVDEILSVHIGVEKGRSFVAIVTNRAVRDYWQRDKRNVWRVSSLQLKRSQPKKPTEPVRDIELGPLPHRKKHCRLCGKLIRVGYMAKLFYVDGVLVAAVCYTHDTPIVVQEKVFDSKRAPQELRIDGRVLRGMTNRVMKNHAIRINKE